MKKKFLKLFLGMLAGTALTMTGCELPENNNTAQNEAQTKSDENNNAAKTILTPTAVASVKPTSTVAANDSKKTTSSASAAKTGDSTQNQQSENSSDSGTSGSNDSTLSQEQGDSENQAAAQEETHDIQYIYISGNIRSSDGNTITVEVGESGNYHNMVFNIENAALNIDNGSSVRSGLNVDLEYYTQNNVNIVTSLSSNGEEYLSASVQEEAQKMADEYVSEDNTDETENEDSEDISFSEY